MYKDPLAYFITFRAYGTWMHGDERGSVDRKRNSFGTPMIPTSSHRAAIEARQRMADPVCFSDSRRESIDRTIREVCEHKGWQLLALNVRTNHVHAVVNAKETPERVLVAFKAWATRRLTEQGLLGVGAKPWSRHGSTIYLFNERDVAEKCDYVLNQQ